ncbi:MAG: hypothetical protein IPQ07_41275 [Myxococcales bacterium]|nr:hypothetical protein [Myxococcales bacterium]
MTAPSRPKSEVRGAQPEGSSVSAHAGKFWVWSAYATQAGTAFVTEIGGLRDADTRRLLGGEKLARIPRLVVQRFEPGRFTDALGAYIGLLLLAPVLVEVLQAAGARLQLVPIGVAAQPELAYAIANVLEHVPALDLERSKLTRFAGTDVIDRVSHLALRPIAADAPPIFHAAEHPLLVVVNDELRQRLQAASPHPGVLTPVEEWRNDR